jgi:ABC-type transport system involved in multi-copper enzyme maturation permease subunit
MAMRWGLGPVFALEWRAASRRWQMYALRALVILILLGALVFVWEVRARDLSSGTGPSPSPKDRYSVIGEAFFAAVIGTQLTLILFAAPGATAGAVCIEKMRGALSFLLVTDLSAAEIVLGKLASRLIPVLGLIACSIPVLMIGTLLGGLDPFAVAGAYAVMFGVGVFGSAVALVLSVWNRRPYEVLLAVYLIEALWVFGYVICRIIDAVLFRSSITPYWLADLNPYILAFAPYNSPGAVDVWDYGLFLAVTCGAAAACTLWAIVSLRPVAARHGAVVQTRKPRPARARPRGGPSLDRDPLLWYEWHSRRKSVLVRIVWSFYVAFAIVGTIMVVWLWGDNNVWSAVQGAMVLNMILPTIGLLVVVVAAVTCLAEERVRGNLDILLTTPLATLAIVWAKWRMAFRPVFGIVALPALLSGIIVLWQTLTANGGHWELVALMTALLLGSGLFLTSLGVALAVWLPRVGRAIAYGVGLYAIQCLGWPLAAYVWFEGPGGRFETGAALVSPIFAGGVLTEGLRFAAARVDPDTARALGWGWMWVGLLVAAAAVLFGLTVATFDRCVGRISDRGRRRIDRIDGPRRRDQSLRLRFAREA